MNKTELVAKIKAIENLSQDEKSALIDLLNHNKRYGLVWEDKPENAEEILNEALPILSEVADKAIIYKPEKQKWETLFENSKDEIPNHILIEGDNLHALTTLCFTHENKIDVIYIDPPYNTGNKDFKYNDHFVDKEDSYRHSKWISFMHKRLKLAKRLLKDTGVIFISIDDNEMAQLKLLCDEIFREENFIVEFVWNKKNVVQNDAKFASINHEYILSYRKTNQVERFKNLPRTDEANARYSNPDNDSRGVWTSVALQAKSGSDANVYEIVFNNGIKWKPVSGTYPRLSKESLLNAYNEGRIWFGKSGKNVPRLKKYLNEVKQGMVSNSILLNSDVGSTQLAKEAIKNILNQNLFETPKPEALIKKLLLLNGGNNSTILDFFAGSGTTLHATMALNAEDGGNRQCVLVTNNENEIAEKVCYERNKKVIEGYTKPNGDKVEGLTNNNLRYYKTAFVGREKTLKNKRQLTELATDLLCIKENCYKRLTPTLSPDKNRDRHGEGEKNEKIKTSEIRVFSENGKTFMVIYDDIFIPKAVEVIKALSCLGEVIKVFVFSEGQDPYTEDFEEVLDRVQLCALPDAIYKAYQNILPKKRKIKEEILIT